MKKKRRRVQVIAKRTVITHAYLYQAALTSLEQARNSEEGSFYNAMSSIVMLAFCLEAYLNHVAAKYLPFWHDEDFKRALNWRKKLALLAHELDFVVDYKQRPFQTVVELFKVRDKLAHGKTEFLEHESVQKLSDEESPSFPDAWWQTKCTVENAERYLHDVTAIGDIIYSHLPEQHHVDKIFTALATGSATRRPLSDDSTE